MKKYTSKEIKEFVSKPLFDEKVLLDKDPSYPKISIVTPSYNQGRFIEETILSVKNQDYPNIEHIIVDGGSTDNTLEILKKYEGTYNMRWISEPDEGQADAINKGFKMCKGSIVYVHAAKADTFPNTILEALACGTPVVATAVGGIPEQVKGWQIADCRPVLSGAEGLQIADLSVKKMENGVKPSKII